MKLPSTWNPIKPTSQRIISIAAIVESMVFGLIDKSHLHSVQCTVYSVSTLHYFLGVEVSLEIIDNATL